MHERIIDRLGVGEVSNVGADASVSAGGSSVASAVHVDDVGSSVNLGDGIASVGAGADALASCADGSQATEGVVVTILVIEQ